jgi:diguanylate cyclase (GGDEF)-like protein
VLLASGVCVGHLALHTRSHRTKGHRPWSSWLRTYDVAMFVGGAAWGSLAILALPGEGEAEYRTVVAMFVIAAMASNTIFSSPLRRLFLAFQTPLAGLAIAGFLSADSPLTTMLAGVVGFSLLFSVLLHDAAHAAAVEAVRQTVRNGALVDELRAERQRIQTANVELRSANARLAHQAGHDGLTDLANRDSFRRTLADTMAAARARGHIVAVLFFDVDRFKHVNDSLGHAVGDRFLIAVTERVRACLRVDDTLARIGGDEFTLLLGARCDPSEAVAMAERIRRSFEEPFSIERREIRATVSIGIAMNTEPGDDADDLLRHADAAMYRAKANGRDRVEVFDARFRAALARRLDDETELRCALQTGRVVSWLQPEVDLHTGRIVGAESLARWLHPERGVVAAGDFVPLAEESGLMHLLGEATSSSTVEALRRLSHTSPDDFRVRMNISALHVTDEKLLAGLLDRLTRGGIDPARLSFEVTETSVIADLQRARRWLSAARAAGITVALDDFGTGYSSLSLLSELPLDGVKIDLSFVRDMLHSAEARAVVTATVELAAALGLEVVAEGVERAEQAAALRDLGVHRAQGYLYAPAVSVDTFADWLRTAPPWTQDRSAASRSPA